MAKFVPHALPVEPVNPDPIRSVSDITFISVDSSNLDGVYYDSDRQELFIMFKASGSSIHASERVYRYSDVPPSVYHDLMNAPSHGKYFHANIKNNYSFVRMQ